MKFRKLLLLILVLTSVFFVGHFAMAQLGVEYGGTTGLGQQDIRLTIANIVRVVLGLIGIIVLALMIYAGFLWMTAAGDEGKVDRAKQILIDATIGLAIVLSAFAITQFIISQLSAATGLNEGAGGPGGGGPGGGLAGGALVLRGISPSGAVPLRNVVVRAIFSGAINTSSVSGNFDVRKTSDNTPVAGTINVNGSEVDFTPSAACPSPNDSVKCFDANTEYTVSVNTGIQSVSGQSLICGGFAPNCTGDFTTGIAIDTAAPQVSLVYPNASFPYIYASSANELQATATDDSGISYVKFLKGETIIDTLVPSTSLKTYNAVLSWDGAGLVAGGHVTLNAAAGDLDSHETVGNSLDVTVLAAHCNNSLKDADETGVDCGGNDCLACSGATCQNNTQCASGSCVSNQCVDQPLILNVDPLDGAVGNLVTISGKYFGTTPGSVVFLGGSGSADDKVASLGSCGNAWSNTQIVAAVPAGAVSGPIRVVAANNLADETGDSRGPQFGNFIINSTVRPGICNVTPISGGVGDEITVRGSQFGAGQGSSVVRFETRVAGVSSGKWNDTNLGVIVPNLTEGDYRVTVTRDTETSNPVLFKVLPRSATLPVISYLDPLNGPIGQYMTVFGQRFGTTPGTIVFKNPATGDEALADTDFPAQCGTDFWHDTYVVVKVPSQYKTGLAVSKNVPLEVSVTRADGAKSTPAAFTINNNNLKPGICKIDPDNGPVGTPVNLFGEHFGGSPGTILFFDNKIAPAAYWNLNGEETTAAVPTEARSGPVVLSTVQSLVSNGVNFEVADCRQNGCGSGEQCCGASCIPAGETCESVKHAGYVWRVATGPLRAIPHVIEEQSCAVATQSPSPWKNTANACVNASVSVRFSTVMDHVTITPATIKITPCGTGINGNFSDGLCGGADGSFSNFIFDDTPQGTAVVVNGNNLLPNLFYRITIDQTVQSTDGVSMSQPYTWHFKTASSTEPCALNRVIVQPGALTLTDKYVNGLEKNSTGKFVASPEAVNCNVLSCAAYQWDWSVNGPANEARLSNTSCQADAYAIAETGTTPLDVVAEAKTLSGLDPHADAAKLTIKFADPRVDAHWPNCDAACVNAQLGATFNTAMNETTLNANNISVRECADSNCAVSSTVASIPFSVVYEAPTNIVRLYPTNLKPNTYYRVLFSNKITSIDGAALTGLNEAGQYFSWVFRTKNDATLCGIAKVDLSPSSATAHIIGESTPFTSVPHGSPDSCNAAGQELNPLSFAWDWNSTESTVGNFERWTGLNFSPYNSSVGDLFNFAPPATIQGCTSQCRFTGALNPALCGNGIINVGEQCDDSNTVNGDGCSNKCLLEGSTGSAICGNGIIEKGEACDDGNAVNGDGCSSQCLNEGSSIYYYNLYNPNIAATFGSACGNGVVERGEDCDFGVDTTADKGIDPMQVVRAVSGVGTKNHSTISTTSNGVSGSADYTVQCGARVDFDCNGGTSAGVGAGTCCFMRPTITTSEPQGANACRNAAIIAHFNQVMAPVTFQNNVLLLKEKGSATTCNDLRVINGVTYCSGPQATFDFVNFDDNGDKIDDRTDAIVRESDALDPTTRYAVVILGDGNPGNAAQGVLSANQVGLATPQYIWTFTTGADICKIQTVVVNPSTKLFKSTAEQQQFTAMPMARSGQNGALMQISPTPTYSWQNGWAVSDTGLIQLSGSTNQTSAVVIPQNKNGVATVTDTVTINDQTSAAAGPTTVNGTAKITNFLCLNPVFIPDTTKHLDLGLQNEYNFSLSYCRDANTPESSQDDLPGVKLETMKPLGLFVDPAHALVYNKTQAKDVVHIALVPGSAPQFNPADIVEEKIILPDCSDINSQYAGACKANDAFGLRIIKNDNHLNPLDWYQANGFEGQPTALTVDGYEAIADGRTVYVAASNLTKTKQGATRLYTDIYVFSYSQNATPETIRIFNQLIANWHFNTNLTETALCQGTSLTCGSDFDCKISDDVCSAGLCQKSKLSCSNNSDCILNSSCNADLQKLRRNIRRITDLTHTSNAVTSFKDASGAVPVLKEGSFVRGSAISDWTSWQAAFGTTLKDTLPTDPLNKFSACGLLEGKPGTDTATCWNDAQKSFSCSPDSQVYLYQSYSPTSFTLYGKLEPMNVSMGTPPSISNVSFNLNSQLCDARVVSSGSPRCGNGTVEFGEQCDGNAPTQCNNGTQQVCNSSCQWVNQSCTRSLSCGNGVVEPLNGETCDDGALNGSYGHCNTSCTGIGLYCGDSVKQPEEFCDAGSVNGNYYGGSKVCVNDPTKSCAIDNDCNGGARCVPQAASCNALCDGYSAYCGDRIVNGSEVCDSNVVVGDQVCENTSNPSASSYKICGAGISCPSGEACTSSASAQGGVKARWGVTCDASCHWSARNLVTIGQCGNGVTDPGEECDDGNTNNSDNCSNTCKLARCGDGLLETGLEQCDQGVKNGIVPTNVPYGKIANYCGTSCKIVTVSGGTCGDGIISGPEQCDSSVLSQSLYCVTIPFFGGQSCVTVTDPTAQFGGKTCADYSASPTGNLTCSNTCRVDISQCTAFEYSTRAIEGVLDWADGASCSIGGWALDPNNTTPVSVSVYKDDPTNVANKLGTWTANQDRPDLATLLGITDTKHGYVITLPLPKDNTSHNIFVNGIASTGDEVPLDNIPQSLACAPQAAPTINFSASPTSVTSGGSSTLSWTTNGATGCTASGAWSGSKNVSGSQSTGAISSTQTYTLSCTGAGGTSTASATVTVSSGAADTIAPTVTITAPANGATVSGTSVLITATASDNVGVVGVQFAIDGINYGAEDLTAPYSIPWNTTTFTNGTHLLRAAVRDAAGNRGSSTVVSVTVSNGAADTTAPTVSITAPPDGSTVGGTAIIISATAADNVGVVGVQFAIDGVNYGAEDLTAPYSIPWDTTAFTNGTHLLRAAVRDAAGNRGSSTVVTVTVSNAPADTTAPTVSVTFPPDGSTVGGTALSIDATAADNVGVVGVQFAIDGVNYGAEDLTAPYSVPWDTTAFTNGTHLLRATARDAAGNRGVSTIVTVTVSNVTPVNNAQFVSQLNVPTTMSLGQVSQVTLTFKNTGNTTWSAGSSCGAYRLGSQNPQDNTTWGFSRFGLDGTMAYAPNKNDSADDFMIAISMAPSTTVAPGATRSFTFNITAPSAKGAYNFQWQMVQECVQWFGDPSTSVVINVGGLCGGINQPICL